MRLKQEKLGGLGIDLVSLPRLRQFLNRHSADALARLFTSREIRRNGKKIFNLKAFARHWAAKEAFFKACGLAWMGFEGFSKIDIHFQTPDHFFAVHEEKKISGRGTVFHCGSRFLGAQAIQTGF